MLLIIIIVIFFNSRYFETTIKPQQVERIINKKELLNIKLRRSLTPLFNEKLTALIQKKPPMAQFYLVPVSIPIRQLIEECHAISDCFGVIYVKVTKMGEKQSQILYQIKPREKSISLACTWVETYNGNFLEIKAELINQIEERALEWVNVCFIRK